MPRSTTCACSSRRSPRWAARRRPTSRSCAGPATPSDAVQWLIDTETELVDALKDAITPTGQEGRSEALEHVLEHIIMRKQNQIDFLLRARRTD